MYVALRSTYVFVTRETSAGTEVGGGRVIVVVGIVAMVELAMVVAVGVAAPKVEAATIVGAEMVETTGILVVVEKWTKWIVGLIMRQVANLYRRSRCRVCCWEKESDSSSCMSK